MINYYNKTDILNNILKNHFFFYPTPKNLNFFWNFGFLSAVFLGFQILSGLLLCFYYTNDVALAFSSVEHLMVNIEYGWFLRYFHANGASFFFIMLYIHILKGLYFKSYKVPRSILWISGIILFLLTMGTAFFGYVLPWGQMSFWGATVISNFLGGIPIIGEQLLIWLWGGFSIDNATLHRIFTIHYLLPFLILVITLVHFFFLHTVGSSNPLNINFVVYLPLYPYFWLKDLFGFFFVLFWFFFMVFFFPNVLGHSDNYIPADSGLTPEHIVPEWYFLPFYAILRSIPNKNLGILLMLLAILFLGLLCISSFNIENRSPLICYYHRLVFWCFVFNALYLGWIGSKPAEGLYIVLGLYSTILYFVFLSFFIFEDCVIHIKQYFHIFDHRHICRDREFWWLYNYALDNTVLDFNWKQRYFELFKTEIASRGSRQKPIPGQPTKVF